MSSLAPLLQSFFTDGLARQRRVSPHTVASYRDTFRLLLGFAADRTGKAPSQLELVDLDTTGVPSDLVQSGPLPLPSLLAGMARTSSSAVPVTGFVVGGGGGTAVARALVGAVTRSGRQHGQRRQRGHEGLKATLAKPTREPIRRTPGRRLSS